MTLAELNEEKKKVYRKWKVGDRCTVLNMGSGTIVAKYDKRDEHGHKTFSVKLDRMYLHGLKELVLVGSCQLELSPDEHRCCVICEASFTARPGTTKKTCGAECAEEYNRQQDRKKRRKH